MTPLESPERSTEVSPTDESRELAHAYIDRRLLEVGNAFGERLAGKRELPLGWHSFGIPSTSVVSELRANTVAKYEFLGWLREEVEGGNPAWTEQLAEQERAFRRQDHQMSKPL